MTYFLWAFKIYLTYYFNYLICQVQNSQIYQGKKYINNFLRVGGSEGRRSQNVWYFIPLPILSPFEWCIVSNLIGVLGLSQMLEQIYLTFIHTASVFWGSPLYKREKMLSKGILHLWNTGQLTLHHYSSQSELYGYPSIIFLKED